MRNDAIARRSDGGRLGPRPLRDAGYEAGRTLLEVLIVLALASVVSTFAVPRLSELSAGLRVRLAASELVGVLRLARISAIREGVSVGVKFLPDEGVGGRTAFRLYRDGDGDGVRSDDIREGIDPALGPSRTLAHLGGRFGFGIPAALAPRDPGDPRRLLKRLDDPIRFNRSDIASFGFRGSSTPGSLYFSDGRGHLAMVRVFNRTGKIKSLKYDPRRRTWRPL